MPELIKSTALVLNTIRWKESSKIVTLFSKKWGIIKVIARGVYRNKSSFAGKLESMNLLDVIISLKSTRSLQILTDADLVDSFNVIRIDMDRFPYAMGILELINQTISEDQADEIFFDFTVHMINGIKIAEKPAILLVYFLLKLSSFLGFKPNFFQCSVCKTSQFKNSAYFSIEKGTVNCKDCAEGANLFKKLISEEISQLNTLQNYPHRKIEELKINNFHEKNFIILLLDYLNFHIEELISITSLNLLS